MHKHVQPDPLFAQQLIRFHCGNMNEPLFFAKVL